jgi:hypothetical protein
MRYIKITKIINKKSLKECRVCPMIVELLKSKDTMIWQFNNRKIIKMDNILVAKSRFINQGSTLISSNPRLMIPFQVSMEERERASKLKLDYEVKISLLQENCGPTKIAKNISN